MTTKQEAYDRWVGDFSGHYIWYWGGYCSNLRGIARTGLSTDELSDQQQREWLMGWDDAEGDKELEDSASK